MNASENNDGNKVYEMVLWKVIEYRLPLTGAS